MAIFNNKKVYLRRKSSRLLSIIMKASLPVLIMLGIYVAYNRSPQNRKLKTIID
jgi:hypothetical protein